MAVSARQKYASSGSRNVTRPAVYPGETSLLPQVRTRLPLKADTSSQQPNVLLAVSPCDTSAFLAEGFMQPQKSNEQLDLKAW